MNQFMSIHAGTPSRDMSILANMKANVHKRLCMCEGYTGVKPSLVTVDHFQVGDVVGADNCHAGGGSAESVGSASRVAGEEESREKRMRGKGD